jgi:signal transduction histidine kinase
MTATATGVQSGGSVASEAATLALVCVVVFLLVLFRQLVFAGIDVEFSSAAYFAASLWEDFKWHLVIALAMFIVIQPARRLGPPEGARRVAVLVTATVFAAFLAATMRSLWLIWYGGNDPEEIWLSWPAMFTRFAIPAGLLVTVGEFYRAELRSLIALRSADADRAVLEQQTLQARLKTLEAQIEPHFLFNTLANVRRLYETDSSAGDGMLERLMRYLEVALPSMRDEHSTLERETRLIEDYLELQRVRMGRRLTYRVDMSSALRHVRVPPMMLLTLVENAIKHGLAPQREGGRVEVGARLDGAQLLLEVADTGRGFGDDTSGGGTGLANIRARLAAMYGDAAEFTLVARGTRGLLATIRMPVDAARTLA